MASREQRAERPEVVLVTGAGSGIGRELAKLFHADGAHVHAVSLLAHELASLTDELDPSGHRLSTRVEDLSTPDAAARLVASCERDGLVVDVLVNNAGFACFGEAVELDPARVSTMIALNVATLTELSMRFGRAMKARRSGSILNVGSIAGMVPAPRFAAYGATKSYVNAFSFALREELAPFGVNVTCLTPGPVATNFAKAAAIDTFDGRSLLKSFFAVGGASSPAEVARAGHAGLRAGRAHVLAGRGAWLSSITTRLVAQRHLPKILKHF